MPHSPPCSGLPISRRPLVSTIQSSASSGYLADQHGIIIADLSDVERASATLDRQADRAEHGQKEVASEAAGVARA